MTAAIGASVRDASRYKVVAVRSASVFETHNKIGFVELTFSAVLGFGICPALSMSELNCEIGIGDVFGRTSSQWLLKVSV